MRLKTMKKKRIRMIPATIKAIRFLTWKRKMRSRRNRSRKMNVARKIRKRRKSRNKYLQMKQQN